MIKRVERTEVLQRVRFANKYYSPSKDLIYKNNEPNHFEDLEILRYNRQDWLEVNKNSDYVYFKTLEDYKSKEQCRLLIVIELKDLLHLTDCGYGFLKN